MTPRKLSAGNVLLCAIALPLWTSMDKCWKRNCVSRGSLVTSEMRITKSWTNSIACVFQDPPVSTAIGTINVRGRQVCILWHYAICRGICSCTWLDCWVVQMWLCIRDPARWRPKLVVCYVTMGSKSLHASGLFPFIDKLTGSFTTGIRARSTARHIISFIEWRWCLGELFLQRSPWSPLASTIVPHTHSCDSQVLALSLKDTATRIISSVSLRLIAVMGGAWSLEPGAWSLEPGASPRNEELKLLKVSPCRPLIQFVPVGSCIYCRRDSCVPYFLDFISWVDWFRDVGSSWPDVQCLTQAMITELMEFTRQNFILEIECCCDRS